MNNEILEVTGLLFVLLCVIGFIVLALVNINSYVIAEKTWYCSSYDHKDFRCVQYTLNEGLKP